MSATLLLVVLVVAGLGLLGLVAVGLVLLLAATRSPQRGALDPPPPPADPSGS